jgi:AI-2 transport protein TqsA
VDRAEDRVTVPARVANALSGPVVRGVVTTAALFVVIAGLRAASPILMPFALAIFIAAVSLPVVNGLRRLRVPAPVAILIVVLINAAALTGVGWILLLSATELRAQLPFYISRAVELEQALRVRLLVYGVDIGTSLRADLVEPQRILDYATVAAKKATSVATTVFLVLLYLVFILAESPTFARKVKTVLGPTARGVEGAEATLREVQRYLVLKTVISLFTGVAIGTGAYLLGVDFALLWGFLAFALNFIPSVGSVIAAVPAVGVALLQLGPGGAAAMALVFLGVNVLIGNFADPIIIGRQLRLSPIVILISLVFWGWTFGVVGAFLALPLTIALRISLEHTTSLSRYAALMGPLDGRARVSDEPE